MKQTPMLKKIITATFGTFLFLIPFKIQTVLFTTTIFLQGNFNPYTAFFLTLPDITLIILLILIGVDLFQKPKQDKNRQYWIIIMIGIAILITGLTTWIWAKDTSAVLSNAVRLILGMLVPAGLLMSKYFKKQQTKLINIFIVSMLIQSAIGILQFISQHALGLHSIGESYIAQTEPGIAKIDLLNKKFIRAYGTFPHPNIFGAFLTMTLFLTPYIKHRNLKWIARILLIVSLLMTFSRSAWVMAVIGGILYAFINKKETPRSGYAASIALISLVVITAIMPLLRQRLDISKDASIRERLDGIKTSVEMIRARPYGIGLGNYTIELQEFTEKKLAPWEYQPVHNTFLLTAAEMGVQGLMVLIGGIAILIICAIREKNWNGMIFGIIMTGLMLTDHYFLTVPQGQYLFGLLAAFTLISSRE